MENVIYRELKINEAALIKNMNPSQFIGNAWRILEGKRKLVRINYNDTDWPNGYEYHYNNLKKTISSGGSAIGAFDKNNKMIGFATINKERFGVNYKYVLLDQLFVTLEYRGEGIGRKLFELSARAAKGMYADRIYICAGSAEETINFYFAIGCKEAVEINEKLYENDPRDIQLEYVL